MQVPRLVGIGGIVGQPTTVPVLDPRVGLPRARLADRGRAVGQDVPRDVTGRYVCHPQCADHQVGEVLADPRVRGPGLTRPGVDRGGPRDVLDPFVDEGPHPGCEVPGPLGLQQQCREGVPQLRTRVDARGDAEELREPVLHRRGGEVLPCHPHAPESPPRDLDGRGGGDVETHVGLVEFEGDDTRAPVVGVLLGPGLRGDLQAVLHQVLVGIRARDHACLVEGGECGLVVGVSRAVDDPDPAHRWSPVQRVADVPSKNLSWTQALTSAQVVPRAAMRAGRSSIVASGAR